MDADMQEFGKCSFKVDQKIEKLFVIAHKTTRSHLEAITTKKLKSILHLNNIVLQHLQGGCFFLKKVLEAPPTLPGATDYRQM